MPVFSASFSISSRAHDELIDITTQVTRALADSRVVDGLCHVYVPHATAAIAINENDDPNIGVDVVNALRKLVIEHDGWLHDRIDNNAASHIKAAIIGPSETIPIRGGRLALGTWQNIFLCEFDGPRSGRSVVVTILS
jgi:secondary thiamine-phosphate synthase enzyme